MSNGSSKPAFPLEWSTFEWQNGSYVRVYHRQHGLTKRELFAAMAMQGILSSWPENANYKPRPTAEEAIAFADALLAALNEPREP